MSIYPPTGTLEIKNATLKIPVVDLQYTSNTAKLEANSNVVTEFSRSKKLIKYPRVALTSASTPTGYIVEMSSSHQTSQDAWYAFDNNEPGDGTSRWRNDNGRYTNSGTTPPNEYLFTGSEAGDWISIQLPEKMKLVYYTITGVHQHTPQEGVIYGYDSDTSTWHRVSTFYFNTVGLPVNNTSLFSPEFHTQEGIGMYSKYAMIVTKTNGHEAPSLYEWKLYGTPEYDPEAHGTDVVVKSYPNVPNTDWLEVYYDAKDLADGTVSTTVGAITGLGGTTNNGTAYGGVTVSDGAFVLDGTNDYITTSALGFSGDQVHTVSIWFRSDRHQRDMTTENGIYGFGYGNNLYAGLSWWSTETHYDSSLRFWHSGSGGKNFPGATFLEDKWNHLVLVYLGDGAFNTRVWLNGAELRGVNNPGNSTNNDFNWSTSDTVVIGDWYSGSSVRGQSPWDGKIANFRLFNRTLTSDEIYQLYAYQKEDFGHSTNNMTLKAGRLGIGTSEPRAALDVRGDIIGGCPVFFRVRKSTDTIGGEDPIIWNEVMVNKGSGYDTTTGKFTAPVSGYYEFIYGGVSGRADWSAEMFAKKNNVKIVGSGAYAAGGSGHWARALMNTVILELNQGDVFHLYQPTGNQDMHGTSNYSYNFFSGKYLSN